MPRISVIIPLYNKAAYIRRAVDSVLAQTEQDFEIIIVDDGSTDGGERVLRSYSDTRIKYVRQENFGVSAARNNGIKYSSAEFVSFLDADDAYYPKFIETVLHLRRKFPQAGLYSTSYCMVEPDGSLVAPKYRAIPKFPWEGILPSYFESALGAPPVSTITVGVNKEVFYSVGYFPEGELLGEDLDMWFRIALKYPVAFSSYVGATYYRNSKNRACGTFIPPQEYRLLKTINSAINTGAVSKADIRFVKGMVDARLIDAAAHSVIYGRKEDAVKYLSYTNSQFFVKEKIFWRLLSELPHKLFRLIMWFKKREFVSLFI